MGRSALARLFVEMQFRDKGVDKGLKSAQTEATKAAGAFGKLGGAIKKVGTIAAGFIVANVIQRGLSAVVGGIGSVINAGSDMAESASKSAAVFGKGYGEIEKAAKGAAFAVGLSKGAYMEAAGTLGNLLKGVGVAQDELPGMSKAIITAAADLGSFNNIDPGQVLEDLRSGLVGEAEPLRKYGILINEAAVQAKGLELGLVDANGEMSEGAKVQARYALIMDQLGDAAGDFKKTQFGLANGGRIVRAILGNLQIWLGGKLAPTLARIQKAFLGWVQAFTDLKDKGVDPVSAAFMAFRQLLTGGKDEPTKWSKRTERLEKALRKVASYWDDFVYGVKVGGRIFMAVLGFIVKHFDVIGPAVLGAVVALKLFALAQAAVTAAAWLMNLSLSPLMIVLLAVAAIGALFAVAWVKDWFGIREKTKAAIDAVLGFLQPFIDVVVKLGHYFHDVATNQIQPGNLAKLPGWLRPIAFVLGRIIKTVRVFVKTWQDKGFMAALAKIPAQIRAFGRAVAGFLESIGLGHTAEAVKKTFYDLASLFKHVVELVDDLVHGRWKEVWSDLKTIAVDLFNLFIDRFKMAGALILDIFNLIPWGVIGSALATGISAAARFMWETGLPFLLEAGGKLIGALFDAMVSFWDTTLFPWLSGLVGSLFNALASSDTWQMIWDAGAFLFDALGKGIAWAWGYLSEWFKKLPGYLVGFFGAAGEILKGVGNDIIAGLWAGISWAWNWMMGRLKELWDGLPNWARKLWGIASPSKVFAGIGKNISAGVAVGIFSGVREIKRAVGVMTSTATGASVSVAANVSGTTPRAGAMAGAFKVNQFGERSIVVESHGGDANRVAHEILRELDNIEAGRLS